MTHFKHSKFQQSTSSFVLIRKEFLPSGRCMAFGLPLTLISTMSNNVDFDAESDRVIANEKESKQYRAFQYGEDGFYEVDTKAQKWFKF